MSIFSSPKNLRKKNFITALRLAEFVFFVHHQAFNLIELRFVSRVGGFHPENPPRRYYPKRRLIALHISYLDR